MMKTKLRFTISIERQMIASGNAQETLMAMKSWLAKMQNVLVTKVPGKTMIVLSALLLLRLPCLPQLPNNFSLIKV